MPWTLLIGGNGQGGGTAMDGLLGLKLMKMMDPETKKETPKALPKTVPPKGKEDQK